MSSTSGGVRRLVLVRHGATESNVLGCLQGWSDGRLTGSGRREIRATAQRLAERIAPARVWSSDLPRALETARLLFPHAEVEPDARLRELCFGEFEGRTHQELLESGTTGYRAWLEDPDGAPPPEGEPLAAMRARVVEWWEDRARDGTVVVVTHGGPAGVLVSHLLDSHDPAAEALPRPGGYLDLHACPGPHTRWRVSEAHLIPQPADAP